MIKTYLLAFLLPMFIYVLFSSVMFRFLAMNTFSPKTVPDPAHETESFLPVGIGFFVALLLPLFLFSEYFSDDIFVFSVFILLLLLIGLLRDISGSTIKMSQFLQLLTLIAFTLFSENGYLVHFSITQYSSFNAASNILINVTIYWFVLNAVRVLAVSNALTALFAIVVAICGVRAFSNIGQTGGVIFSIALLGTFVPYLISILIGKPAKTPLADSGSAFLGFSLLFMAIQLSHAPNSLIQHDSELIHPITGMMGIFFLPVMNIVRVFVLSRKNAEQPNKVEKLNIIDTYKKKMLINDITASVLICTFGIVVALSLLVSDITFVQAFCIYAFIATTMLCLPEIYQLIGRTITGKANERPMP